MAADMEKIEMLLMEHEERLEKTLSVFKNELLMVRVGRANPHVLDKVVVDFYGTPTPINQVGNMSVVDGQCLVVTPWDKSLLKNVEKAIQTANIGINPTNDGNVIRLIFPALTEERRKELTKKTAKMGEDCKVAIRNIRREANDAAKLLKKNSEITEDDLKSAEKTIQDVTDKLIKEVDAAVARKDKEIMEI